jgi:hypothetical protein
LAANGEASHWTSHHAEQGEGRFSFSAGERKLMIHFVVNIRIAWMRLPRWRSMVSPDFRLESVATIRVQNFADVT